MSRPHLESPGGRPPSELTVHVLLDNLRARLGRLERSLRGGTQPLPPGERFYAGVSRAELDRLGPFVFVGAALGIGLCRLFFGGREMGVAPSVFWVLAVMTAGMLAGIQLWWLLARPRRPLIVVGSDRLYLRRDGETVAELPLAQLTVSRFGERREEGEATPGGPSFLLGATLGVPGQRAIHVYTYARRTDLVGLPAGATTGLLLERKTFDALLHRLTQMGVNRVGSRG